MRPWVVLACLVGVVLVPPHAGHAQGAGPAGLSGVWALDPEASTALPEPPRRDGGGRSGGPPRGGMGRPGGMPGFGRPSEDDLLKMEALARRVREAPPRLTIVQDASGGRRVAFTEQSGAQWAVTLDGKAQTRLTGDGELELKARHEGDALVVVEDMGSKRSITYHYRVLREGDRDLLEVTLTPKGPMAGRGPGGRGGRRGTSGPDGAGGGDGPPPIVRVYVRVG